MATPPGLVLYPLGTGSPRDLERGPIVQFQDPQWFPDSRHIFFTANEATGPVRCYRQAIDGGPPEPVAVQAAATYSLLTRDGQAVLGQASDSKWCLYPLAGGEPRLVPGLRADDTVIAWSREGTAVYVTEVNLVPSVFVRVDLVTGQRTDAFTLGPERSPGLLWLNFKEPVLDPVRGYAYSYQRTLSQIYVVKGGGL
jgi:hypothetical protein